MRGFSIVLVMVLASCAERPAPSPDLSAPCPASLVPSCTPGATVPGSCGDTCQCDSCGEPHCTVRPCIPDLGHDLGAATDLTSEATDSGVTDGAADATDGVGDAAACLVAPQPCVPGGIPCCLGLVCQRPPRTGEMICGARD
jgi:hypothetical protein